jgi:CDP-diacylglycerol--serine O-phosphatidyltransferase
VLAACVFYSPARLADPLASGLVSLLVLVLAGLMVSRLRYRSFKEFNLRSRVPWVMVSLIGAAYFVVAASPQIIGVVLSFAYLLSGLVPRRAPGIRPEPRPAPAGGGHGPL